MKSKIYSTTPHIAIGKLLLFAFRTISEDYTGVDRPGSHADEILLCCAVVVGQAEGKPMKPAKLADFVGLPRATTIRKLESLRERGLLEIADDGYYQLPIELLNSPHARAAARKVTAAIKNTAAILSKMDTRPIAGK